MKRRGARPVLRLASVVTATLIASVSCRPGSGRELPEPGAVTVVTVPLAGDFGTLLALGSHAPTEACRILYAGPRNVRTFRAVLRDVAGRPIEAIELATVADEPDRGLDDVCYAWVDEVVDPAQGTSEFVANIRCARAGGGFATGGRLPFARWFGDDIRSIASRGADPIENRPDDRPFCLLQVRVETSTTLRFVTLELLLEQPSADEPRRQK
jgi:hypothetical protein